jgi:hypothetical protein
MKSPSHGHHPCNPAKRTTYTNWRMRKIKPHLTSDWNMVKTHNLFYAVCMLWLFVILMLKCYISHETSATLWMVILWRWQTSILLRNIVYLTTWHILADMRTSNLTWLFTVLVWVKNVTSSWVKILTVYIVMMHARGGNWKIYRD